MASWPVIGRSARMRPSPNWMPLAMTLRRLTGIWQFMGLVFTLPHAGCGGGWPATWPTRGDGTLTEHGQQHAGASGR